ncbi:TldD/PmbA family protein [Pseudomonas mucidolens]|uniref:TldD/PmbA family protein n=1 Tax=Pseudomonas mucidolens TaxID=46679 RepID=UPI0030DD1C72
MTAAFSNSPTYLAELAEQILKLARSQGASHAQVSLSQSRGLSLSMRQSRVQSRVRETHSGYSLTVFMGKHQGSVNSTDLNPNALSQSVKAACAIARYTGEDAAAGPASSDQLCSPDSDLNLFHPWDIDEDQAVGLAQRLESGLESAGGSVQSEGVWVNSHQSYFLLATSEGFNQGVAKSSHSLGASALARNDQYSERDHWSESSTDARNLSSVEQIGRNAGLGAAAYLNKGALSSRRCAVLFDPRTATSLIGHFIQAISGQALYTNATFLKDQIGQPVMSDHLRLYEDPYLAGGNASKNFDSDGIAPQQRYLVEDGVLKGYLLSLYGARRLGMEPTGNGFGPGNLLLSSKSTGADDDLPAMLRTMGTGLLVTSLAGNGVRLISGDYSRGARGYWVENGEIQHAVTGITIAANLKEMLKGIVAVGSDVICQGPFSTGSILIEQMQISGQ